MRLLQYKDLDLRRVKPAFAKVRAAIEAGDFKSPDVKKLHVGNYYRARLDHSNRLLLQFARHGGETVCLALEVIENHAYDKSRFLRGAPVDEAKIEHEPDPGPGARPEPHASALAASHAQRVRAAGQAHRLRRRAGYLALGPRQSLLAPKALDRLNPSSKQKQALLDYALWHGQQRWVERPAQTGFGS